MRREATVIVAVGLGLSLASCRCPEGKECLDPETLPAENCPEGETCMAPPDPRGDQVPGCPDGASLVKVEIVLTPGGERGCEVGDLQPETVCVLQGGVIQWKVDNRCDLASRPEPVLQITGSEVGWLTAACDARFETLERGMARGNQLLCNVPDETAKGNYKYAVEGPDVDRHDPRIVVRGPGGG